MKIFSRHPSSVFFLFSLFSTLCSDSLFCHATNIITRGQLIRDGETIVSSNQRFVLGFFGPPGNTTTSRYVGVWYNEIEEQTVIWVANRERPVSGEGGALTIGNEGNLRVLDGNGNSVWSTNASVLSSNNNSTAVLMDNGNLILLNNESVDNSRSVLWESFNHPTDTFLPEMRIPVNGRVEGGKSENHILISWKSASDPSPGNYSLGLDYRESPQIVMWEGVNRRWRSGHWTGLVFAGVPNMRTLYLYGFQLATDSDGERYFTYTPSNTSELIKFQIRPDGFEEQTRWDEDNREWSSIQSEPYTECDFYNRCGAFGICIANASIGCSCIEGFVPRRRDEWNRGDWSGGCVRRTELGCRSGNNSSGEDGFWEVQGVKVPDILDYAGAEDINACRDRCLRNCSCSAFASVSGINCMIWGGDLIDIQQFQEGGNTLYVRLANSELETGGRRKVARLVIIVIAVVAAFVLIVSILLLWVCRSRLKAALNSWRKNNKLPDHVYANKSREFSTDTSGPGDLSIEGQQGTGPELALFSFSCVAFATNHFSERNKLGQGGFGPVYRGTLPGGEEIAVKRLSRKSGQGQEEFKNEITMIAKLQHRNLVRLLGCCIEGEEKMLLYEYMPNKSLDSYLFDPTRRVELDWKKRFQIIEGIARGLLYLHRDSRLRIIHRDLKASNILLDEEMNPKISDFGMARIFGGNQNEANTNRVVGTYGYMSPEYAMEGLFSVKSDVYSFGILLLEIVSGRRNSSFRSPEHSSIIGYAWELWDSGKAMDLIDPCMAESCCQNEVLRCIHVAMLCVQDMAIHRPTMSSVLLMLESEAAALPLPRQPTFTSMRRSVEADLLNESQEILSLNDVTVSMIAGR